MAWNFKVCVIDGSGDFHKAIKHDIDMVIDSDGKINHQSDRKDELAARKGYFDGDTFVGLVKLGKHEHLFLVKKGSDVNGKGRFMGRLIDASLIDVSLAGEIRIVTHNGTWHGIGN